MLTKLMIWRNSTTISKVFYTDLEIGIRSPSLNAIWILSTTKQTLRHLIKKINLKMQLTRLSLSHLIPYLMNAFSSIKVWKSIRAQWQEFIQIYILIWWKTLLFIQQLSCFVWFTIMTMKHLKLTCSFIWGTIRLKHMDKMQILMLNNFHLRLMLWFSCAILAYLWYIFSWHWWGWQI